jgi:hypothetical protein
LEGEDKEEVHAVYLNGDQGSPEDDAMGALEGYTQQEDTDAEFEEDVRDNVGGLAGPPPLIQVISIVGYIADILLHTFMPMG